MNFKRLAAMVLSVVMMLGATAWTGGTEAYAASVVGRGVTRTGSPAGDNVSLSAFLTGPGVNVLPIEMMSYVEYHFDPTIAALATLMMVITLGIMLLIEKTLGLKSVV